MRLERKQNAVTVYLEGELDHFSAQQIRRMLDQCIQENDVKKLVLDMKGMTFMDSSGIGVILGRYKMMRQKGGRLAVRNMNKQVEKVFRLSGMEQLIEVV